MIGVKTNAHVVQPVPAPEVSPAVEATPESLGWPLGFFEETFGVWKGELLERLPQGEYEEHEVIE